ncbi:MAG: molybdopterin-dependent oxidoreductase, partial [Planctomycetales bacterium]|nr:molybdopterin-dependent oxidoreductase [Planctomycetales bacterium]
MDRRAFLALGSAGTASALVGCTRETALAPPASAGESPLEQANQLLGVVWDKAPCRYCGTGCGVEVAIRDNRVVAVRGDEKADVNKGLLCAKGYHLPGMLYGEDRLTHPQKRSPDGTLTKISWEEALQLIADKYTESIKESGPASVGIYGSGQWTIFDGYAANKWFKGGIGSNNIDPNARLCMASAVMGFVTQFQSDEPMGCYDDLDIADDFVLWGNNMAEMHPVLFSRMLENKQRNPSVRIIDIATRWTPTSDFADLYVQIVPGTDLALANGILHLLIKNNKVDEAFVAENLVFKRGIEELDKIGYGCFDDQAEKYTFAD